jgi:hypothetical protein
MGTNASEKPEGYLKWMQKVPPRLWYVSTKRRGFTFQKTVQVSDDGGSRLLRNTGTYLPNYRMSHPRRQYLLATLHSIVLRHTQNHIFLSYHLNENIFKPSSFVRLRVCILNTCNLHRSTKTINCVIYFPCVFRSYRTPRPG